MQRMLTTSALSFASAELYCPSENDFSIDGGSWVSNGWSMTGGGGAHGKQTFNLLGGYIEFDMDTSAALGGVNNNFYLVSPDPSYFSASNDCDIQAQGKPACMEMDIIENNGNCLAQTTWHTWPNHNGDCDQGGCWGQHYRSGVTRVRAEFTEDGWMTVLLDGYKVDVTHPVPSENAHKYVRETMATKGAQIQSSQWVGWVPSGNCPGGGTLSDSTFTVRNIKVSGTVIQGREPSRCSSVDGEKAFTQVAVAHNQSMLESQWCSARGGCSCDCGWASASKCETDDGSCCFACCCGSTPPVPTPAPSPRGPLTEYCPDTSEDFQEEVEGPPGSIAWSPQGWRIQGQRRVSSKASFDLRGGSVEWDMDLSQSHGGVNSNLYVTFPHQPNCGKACYCDSGATGGCSEMDYTENNGGCFQATTWHEDPSGGDKSGHGGSGGLSGGVVHMKATYSGDGSHLDMQVGGNHYSGNGMADELAKYGAVIYSSQWVGWVPGSCGGDGNLQASSFSVSNLKIIGSIVQGPEPNKCESALEWPTAPQSSTMLLV